MKLQKRLCNDAPYCVLGPLPADIAPGYDHIVGAIVGAIAAGAGADFLCYVTPAEHLGLPTVQDVREGVIASCILYGKIQFGHTGQETGGLMKFKGIVTVIRVPFLILALILGILGAAVAWYESRRFGSPFVMKYALLATFGLLVAHAAVNIFNEYFDCRSGLDYRTRRTPFSGGSGAIPSGLLTLHEALWLGIACFAFIIPIGVFFTLVKGWMLVPLLVLATLLIVLYTPFILKMGYPEWSPGLGLGILPVMGAYFVHTGQYTLTALIASMPSYFLVHNLLLLNEFPDVEADVTIGRRTLPIAFGKKRAAVIFSLFVLLVYLWIVGAVVLHAMPPWTLLALLTLPIALQVIKGSFRYDDMELFLPVMMKNVQLVLLTQALIAMGYILAGIF